jgi:hypothetical protein
MLSGLFTGPTVIFRQSGFNLKLIQHLISPALTRFSYSQTTKNQDASDFLFPKRSEVFSEIYAAIVLNANGGTLAKS